MAQSTRPNGGLDSKPVNRALDVAVYVYMRRVGWCKFSHATATVHTQQQEPWISLISSYHAQCIHGYTRCDWVSPKGPAAPTLMCTESTQRSATAILNGRHPYCWCSSTAQRWSNPGMSTLQASALAATDPSWFSWPCGMLPPHGQ